MSKKSPDGMMMSPNSGKGSSTGGSGKKKRPPTGEVRSSSGKSDFEEDSSSISGPIEVIFTQQTFTKLIAWVLGPMLLVLISAISAFFYFYHQTSIHLSDPTIHLTRGERAKLETKIEAKVSRKKLKTEITNHFDLKVREIKVENGEHIEKLGDALKKEQTKHLNKILIEVKKARQDIRSK